MIPNAFFLELNYRNNNEKPFRNTMHSPHWQTNTLIRCQKCGSI